MVTKYSGTVQAKSVSHTREKFRIKQKSSVRPSFYPSLKHNIDFTSLYVISTINITIQRQMYMPDYFNHAVVILIRTF